VVFLVLVKSGRWIGTGKRDAALRGGDLGIRPASGDLASEDRGEGNAGLSYGAVRGKEETGGRQSPAPAAGC